jgi:hypothetical protein
VDVAARRALVPLTANTVGDRREERREDRGGRHARRGDEAHRGDTAVAECHDGQ